MSGFLFSRNQSPDRKAAEDSARMTRAIVEAQSITASAIFALLVSKGVLTAAEAADYMGEIGATLARDVGGDVGAEAGGLLAAYGDALRAAGG